MADSRGLPAPSGSDRLARINECLVGLGPDYQANVDRITRLCGELLGATCALYNRLDGALLCSLGMWHAPPDYSPEDRPEGHICYDVIRRDDRSALVIRDLPSTPYAASDPNVARYGLKTYIGVPVRCGKWNAGSLCAVFQRDFQPGEDDTFVVGILASALSAEEERRRALEALRESEQKYRSLYESSRDAIMLLFPPDWRFAAGNPATVEMFRARDEAHFTSVRPWELSPERQDDGELSSDKARRMIALAMKDGSHFFEWTHKRIGGGEFPATVLLTRVVIGGRTGLQATVRDVTRHKKAESDLQAWKALVESVVENVPFMIFLKEAVDLRFVIFNRAGEELLGYDRKSLLGRNNLDLFPPEQAAWFMAKDREALGCGDIIDIPEEPILTAKKGQRILHTKKICIKGPDGVTKYLLGISEDITERKEAEAALRASEAKYRTLVETTGTGYLILDGQGRVVDANAEYVRLTGRRELREILGRGVVEWTAPADRERNAAAVARCVAEGFVRSLVVDYVDAAGRVTPVEINATCEGGGESLRIVSLCRDITERRAMERSLQDMRMQRLESLGTLAGGIAHDFNNMLSGVLGSLSLLGTFAKARRERSLVREAEGACQAAKGLARQLLTFASGGKPAVEVRALGPLVKAAVLFSARGSKLRCRFRAAKGRLLAKVDEGQLVQALQNLVLNSVQAVEGPGDLGVELAGVELSAGELPPLPPGKYARITLRDSGPGIPAEHLPKIFDPYFSTKGTGRGLGLAVCHSIISRHGGHLGIDSRPGEGAVFTIHLPAVPRAPKARAPRKAPAAPKRGRRVLLMDDDRMVVRALSQVLESLGCSVKAAPSGEKAVAEWRRARAAGRPFDAVILDLTVAGGMGGREALSRIQELDPGARAIVSSGYSTDPVLSDHKEHGFCAMLPKPFRVEDVSAALAAALGRPARRR